MKRFFNPATITIMILLVASSLMDRGFSNPADWLMDKLLILPAIILGLSVHEFGHAWTAHKLGDNTPYNQGRVTLNPGAHIDPVGFISLLFIGFGWGVPVQINPGNFKKPRRDELIVSFAGVTLNFVMAIAFAVLIKFLIIVAPDFMYMNDMGDIIFEVLLNCVFINIILMVFNLLPIPPLDGFNIVTELFKLRRYSWWYRVYNNGFFILLVFILFDITDLILTPAVLGIYSAIISVIF